MIEELAQTVDKLVRPDSAAEFAYLAVTSKVELPFRDRLAYALESLAEARGERVAREYKRCDLAWLSDSGPRMFVELKACYLFDLALRPTAYFDKVATDLAKARRLGGSGVVCAAILLATDVKAAIPAPLVDTVKYSRDINAAIARFGGVDALRSRALEEAGRCLGRFSQVRRFRSELGLYRGVGVDLHGWILEGSTNQLPNLPLQPTSGA